MSDLIVGNEYYFRVYSENICGLSDSPGVSKNTARILKTGADPLPWGPVTLGLQGRALGHRVEMAKSVPWLGLGQSRWATLQASLSPGITLKPLEYKEHDFRTPPKFLTPLIDRVVVAGYSAALNCAVRGHPKVWGQAACGCTCVGPRGLSAAQAHPTALPHGICSP